MKLATCIILSLSLLSCSATSRPPPESLSYKSPCGYSVDTNMCEITLYDQYDRARVLNDLNGVKVLQFSAMWCAACAHATYQTLHIKKLYETSVSYAVILLESYEENTSPSIGDVQQWALELNLHSNVFKGTNSLVDEYEETGFNIEHYPTYYVVSADNVILGKFSNSDEVLDYLKMHIFGKPTSSSEVQ